LVEQLLLALKVAFVVLLYLFVWRVIRVASKDVAVGQESMVLTPVRAKPKPSRALAALVVSQSPQIPAGTRISLDRELVAGRGDGAAIELGADGYASHRHARFLRGEDGDLVEDLGSTNGTFVNGEQLAGGHLLKQGDVITIGQTQLTYEAGR
jgi:predicted component of type VI protein secretion system